MTCATETATVTNAALLQASMDHHIGMLIAYLQTSVNHHSGVGMIEVICCPTSRSKCYLPCRCQLQANPEVALFTGKHEPSLRRVGCYWWLSWANLEIEMCHDVLHLLPSVVGVLDTCVGLGQGE